MPAHMETVWGGGGVTFTERVSDPRWLWLCRQEAEETLFVRRQRLRSVGGFTLLLLHCLSHVQVKDLTSDSSPAFQRLFFKVHTPSVH